MILRIKGIEEAFLISDEYVTCISFEDKDFFSNVIFKLFMAIEHGIENDEIRIFDNKQVDISKEVELIIDVLNYNINNRSIQTKLYKYIENILLQDFEAKHRLDLVSENILQIVSNITLDIEGELMYKHDIEIKDYLKMISLEFDDIHINSIFDKVLLLIDVLSNFANNKIIFLVNISHYLSNQKIQEICKYAVYMKIKLLILEQNKETFDKEHCKQYYIDKDYDVFYR